MHQKVSIETMGITARPAPRMTAARQWVSASRQKNGAQVRIFITPKAMPSGSWVKAPMSSGASQYSSAPISSARATEQTMPNRAPFLVRCSSPAPRFCPTKVVMAAVKLVMGRKAKPSTLE